MVRTFFRKSANPRVRAAVLEVLETRQFFDATLTPTADTFVRDGTSAGNVYGSYALLQSKQGAAGVQRQIYEKFDLSGLSGSISHATLQIYGNRSNTNDSTFSIAAAGMSDNSWSEGSTTWNNKPAVGSTLNTASVTSTTKGLINLDVTSYLQQAQTNGQTTVSIAIVGTANTDAYFEMSSREGTNSPQLILTTGSTAPAAPTNLTASSVQTNAVTLNWADNSNNETGFQVQRKQGTGAWATLTTTSANATSYIDTTVSAGQSYSYQVIAVNAAGSSASSNTVNASVPAASTTTFTPTADTYVRDSTFSSTTFGTSGTAAARLSTTSTNNRQIYLKFDLSSLSGSVSSATLNVYGYRSNTNDSTFAIAAAQMSDNSWTESSTDWDNKPAVGSTISTANVPNTSYQWISLDVSSYIQAAKANNQSVVSIAIVGAAATTDYFTMLTRESQNAPQLVVASSTTANAPAAPANVVATGASSMTVHVTWNDVATNETGYQVQYRLQGSTGAYTSLTLPAGSTSADITNLTAGTAYELQVTALGSTNSAAVAATASTLAAPVVTASSPKQEGASITLGVDLGSPAPSGVSYAWTLTGETLSSTTAAAPTFTPADDGSYTAAVTVTYANGDTAAASLGIAVLNVAPMLTIAGTSTISTGQSYALTVNHSDPGTDTIQSWAINWGDGSAVQIFTGSTPSPTHIFSTVGTYTISATATDEDGTFSAGNTLAVNVTNNVPTVATAAAATPNPASGTTASLSVLGADDGGESNLTYTWSATGPAAVTYSGTNGANTAKNTTATFSKAGTYNFVAAISDGSNSTTSNVSVVVNQTLTSIVVTPATATIGVSGTQQFVASGQDQFGNALVSQPAFTWSVATGSGTVSSSGQYTAPSAGGAATVRATSGAVSSTITITISNAAPTVVTAANAGSNPVIGTTIPLSVLGADDGGESNLTYTWSATGPAAVTFSPANGTNLSKNTTATFAQAGTYTFIATISDRTASTTSSVTVVVNRTPTSIAVSPTSSTVSVGSTEQFSATASDQFGQTIATPPAFSWTVSNGTGTVSSSGVYTAFASSGSATVTAAVANAAGNASITLTTTDGGSGPGDGGNGGDDGGGDTGPTDPPSTPKALLVKPKFDGGIILSWDESSTMVDSYLIQRSDNGQAFVDIGTIDAKNKTFFDTSLSGTHNYQYRAAANNAFGTSSWSEPIASSIGRPGDVDHQFGIDGSAVTHFGTGSTGQAYLVDFLPEPDGKIIELGQVTGSLVSKVTRINSDGSIDTDFGDNGLVTLPASFETPYRTALALDSQGGILIAGKIYATNSSSVLRLTNAGTIDGSFSVSDAGQFGALAGSGPFLDIEAIGTGGSNIYVVARVSPQGSTPAATDVFAFHEDGRLDLSFGQGGKMRLASYVYNGSLVIDTLKQLYIAGTSQSSQYPNGTAVAQRVFASGAQDFSYGNNGVALGNLTLGVGQFAYEIALDSHGRLIISGNGSFVPGQLTHGFLVRLNSQGVLDSGFASGGIYSFQGTAGAGVAVDSLSQIYLTVQSVVDSHYHYSVFSLDQLGDINTSFGNHGSIDLISNVPSGQLRIDNANRLVTGFYFLDRNIDDPTLRLTRIFLFGQTGIYADSNNDGNVDAYEATTGSDLFDISTIGQTGKIIKVNDDDTDQDGVPDYADGFSPFGPDSATPADDQTDGESFTPIEISIPTTIDPQTAHFTFTYSGSDPMNANRTGDGSSQNPFVYTPAGGAMRIWTVDGDQNRDGHSAGSGGDYIVPGVAYTAAQLGMPQGGTKTFYIEGIAPRTAFNSDQEIKLNMTDGDVTVDSSVRVTIAPNLIRTDGNRDGTVSFDAKDDKDYYFWKNNNLDGNADIDGVSVPQSLLPIDGHNGNDSSDQTISDARDLQDFMHVEIGVPTFFNPADYTLRLHWDAGTYSDGAAGINAFEVDQNTADNYLKDSAVAQSAITGSTFLKRFTATDDYDFGAGYVVLYSASTGRINLLIEGVSIGDGTLTAEWVKNSHAVVQDAIHLKIRSVESMYDEYSNAVGSGVSSQGNWTNGDPTAGGTAQVPQSATLVNPDSVPDMATSSDYIVFVPGWNNREADRISSADTAFKRLFWSGFTGHFALFSWPTQVTTSPATDPGNFDRSEFIALESAVAFNDALQKIKTAQSDLDLPDGSDKVTVLAHSQGNYVLDEALRTASKKLVDNAIMSQAAVSSDLFDASSALPTIYTGASPNSHDKILNGNRTYDGMPAADGIGGASPRYQAAKLKVGHLVNFFNPDDFALAAWDLDQSQKPSSEFNFSGDVTRKNVVTSTFVAYLLTLEPAHRYFNGDAYRVDSATGQISYSSIIGLDPGSGQPIYSLYAPLNLNSTKALHEAMAFAVGSDGQAVGENCALGVAQGFSDVQNINLLSSKFDDTRAGHSAQFYYDMPTTASYWAAVLARSKA